MFGTIFVIAFIISLFWNTLSGSNMFPLRIVFWASVVLTVVITTSGWVIVNSASSVILKNDSNFQNWKERGGRPYWDNIGWPVNTSSDIERETGLAEPKYTTFVPPHSWKYQCPVCGSRVEKAVDICWNCNYGAEPPARANQSVSQSESSDCRQIK